MLFGHNQSLPPRLFEFVRLLLRTRCSNDSIPKQPACQWKNFLSTGRVPGCKLLHDSVLSFWREFHSWWPLGSRIQNSSPPRA